MNIALQIPPAVLIYILYYKWLRCVENQDDLFIRMFGFAFLPGAAITVGLEVVSSAVFSLIFIPEQVLRAPTVAVMQCKHETYSLCR